MTRPAAFIIALALGAMTLTPGSGARAEPTAITACQTISQPGSYRLANNLTATGDCLVITTDGVTIDLAGFSISGSGSGTGITAAVGRPGERLGIAVRNGLISRFLIGVDLTGASGSIVEGLRVFRTIGTGIVADGIVTRNIVSGTETHAGDGIEATGVVTWNNASQNVNFGIAAGLGSTLIGNVANNNGLSGISVACPSNVTDNTAIGNGTARPGFPNIELSGEGCNNTNNVAP